MIGHVGRILTCKGGWGEGSGRGQVEGVQGLCRPPQAAICLGPHQHATPICIAVLTTKPHHFTHLHTPWLAFKTSLLAVQLLPKRLDLVAVKPKTVHETSMELPGFSRPSKQLIRLIGIAWLWHDRVKLVLYK